MQPLPSAAEDDVESELNALEADGVKVIRRAVARVMPNSTRVCNPPRGLGRGASCCNPTAAAMVSNSMQVCNPLHGLGRGGSSQEPGLPLTSRHVKRWPAGSIEAAEEELVAACGQTPGG